jgi:hypothetical protein
MEEDVEIQSMVVLFEYCQGNPRWQYVKIPANLHQSQGKRNVKK